MLGHLLGADNADPDYVRFGLQLFERDDTAAAQR
jgi:hypothetical protein